MTGKYKFALAIAIIAIGVSTGVYNYTQSPDYIAGQQLKAAQQAVATGDTAGAAELFATVALTDTPPATTARQGLAALLDQKALLEKPASVGAQVIRQAKRVNAGARITYEGSILRTIGWALIDANSAKDPAGSKAVLDAIASIESDKGKLAKLNEALLEAIVKSDAQNTMAATELAVILDSRHDCNRCEALLSPHAAKLGKSEAARILGQIYASKGLIDESYALLLPYTEEKLKHFTDVEDAYRKTGDRLEQALIADLRTGKANKDFYDAYDKADEQGKREMVGAYLNEHLAENAELKQSVQSLREAAAIVPTALDLGVVMVQRANKLEDAGARNKQFQAAEKVFLAIKGAAGDSDDYRYYLGQVSYWLGKQDEGKKLFDELLVKHDRQYGVLMSIGTLLRSVGAIADARSLVEEAYRKAKSNEEKWEAAHTRSVMFRDADDELVWLTRADPSNVRVRASIHHTRGALAHQKGQLDIAKKEYQAAIVEFGKMPESATQLNSIGLLELSLYSLDGEQQHADRGLALLDQALGLLPSDSILLLNNISAISSAAAGAMMGSTIDFAALKTSADFELLGYLHNDAASQEKLRQKLRDSAAVKKGIAYSDKAALLAPRHPASYGFPIAIYGFLEDFSKTQPLLAHIEAAHLDISDAESSLADARSGKNFKSDLEKLRTATQQQAVLMTQPSVKRSAATSAVASGRWISSQITLARWGQTINADELVNVARKASATYPCSATHSTLMEALETRASLHLMKLNPAFAASVAQHGKLLAFSDLLVIHMDEDPEFLKLAVADPDVVALMAMVRERDTRYPQRSSSWAWMLFKNVDEKYAESLAKRVTDSADFQAYMQLGRLFSPHHPDAVKDLYQLALLKKDKATALRVLDEARRDGVPLPDLIGKRIRG